MFILEIKKLFRNKNMIIALLIYIVICIAMIFIRPASEEGVTYLEVSFYKVFNYRVGHPLVILSMIIIIANLLCNIYSQEVISKMDGLILASKNKNKCLNGKMAVGILVPAISYISFLFVTFIVTVIQYGRPRSGKLKALGIVDNDTLHNMNFSINEYISLKILFVLLVLISISVVATLISFKTKTTIESVSGFSLYLIMGKVVYIIIKSMPKTIVDFIGEERLQVLNYGNYPTLIFITNDIVGINLGSVDILGCSLDILFVITVMLILITLTSIGYMALTFKKLSLNK